MFCLNPAQMVREPHWEVQYDGSTNLLGSTGPALKLVKSMLSSGTCSNLLGVWLESFLV